MNERPGISPGLAAWVLVLAIVWCIIGAAWVYTW